MAMTAMIPPNVMPPNDLSSLLQPWAVQVLKLCLKNDSEESARGFLHFLVNYKLPDGHHIQQFINHPHHGMLETRAEIPPFFRRETATQMLLGLAHWISAAIQQLDMHVPLQSSVQQTSKLEMYLREEKSFEHACKEFSDFLYHVILQLLGPELTCVASSLSGTLADGFTSDRSVAALAAWPSLLLAQLVNLLEDMRAKVLRIALELAPYDAWRLCHHALERAPASQTRN
eukprot:g1907.t1